MIIVRLLGGLGNQFFQYALGRNLALKLKTELKFDLFSYDVDKKRVYELDKYNISDQVKIWGRPRAIFKRVLNHLNIKSDGITYLPEKKFNFDPNVLRSKNNIYLGGYWQSYKYFESINDLIKEELTLKQKPDQKNAGFLQLVKKESESVGLHIRRGDYISDKRSAAHHGAKGLEYYGKAIDYIGSKLSHPSFFIFSDDIAWVKENLKINAPTFYADFNSPGKGSEDLRLMSNCNHFIIANSSFSWWAAWLGLNLHKIVIAPKLWFMDPKIDTSDLIPDNWVRF